MIRRVEHSITRFVVANGPLFHDQKLLNTSSKFKERKEITKQAALLQILKEENKIRAGDVSE